MVRRARTCLDTIKPQHHDTVLAAAVRLTAWRKPEGAAAALLDLLPGANEVLEREIKAALVVFADNGNPDTALVKALDDKNVVKRTAAAAVLGKDGGAYLKQPGRLVFPGGLKQPMKWTIHDGQQMTMELEVTSVEYYNAFDPKLFAKP